MPQKQEWEKEYRNSSFISQHDQPQKFLLRFLKYLKKEEKISIKKLRILDLGCGTGRNSNYLAGLGAQVSGIEISNTALDIAKKRAEKADLRVDYIFGNIGDKYNFKNNFFNLILDITSSNSLNNKERQIYLNEVNRVLKPNGLFFSRVLCKDGDKNAKKLLKINPGQEYDTYILPGINIRERVFSKDDFIKMYSEHFKIIKIIKESGYSKFNNQSYKRNFLLAYLRKN